MFVNCKVEYHIKLVSIHPEGVVGIEVEEGMPQNPIRFNEHSRTISNLMKMNFYNKIFKFGKMFPGLKTVT